MGLYIDIAIGATIWTSGFLLAATMVWTLVSVRYKLKSLSTHLAAAVVALGLALLCFQLCVRAISSPYRGTAEYHAWGEAETGVEKHYLPTKARSITMNRELHRQRARYHIAKADLTSHVDSMWSDYADHYGGMQVDREALLPANSESIADQNRRLLNELGWAVTSEMLVMESPFTDAGGGCYYYYDAGNEMAYHSAWYW